MHQNLLQLAMYSMKDIPLTLLVFLLSLPFISAVPTWEGMNGRSSIGSLIPGASFIEAKGPVASGPVAQLLDVHVRDSIGNLTIMPSTTSDHPIFYINQNQLWLLVNETTVYPVNIHNSTSTHKLPMQLVLGKTKQALNQGTWAWKATSLYYEFAGGRTNKGLYFRCLTPGGSYNVFMAVEDQGPPSGCQIMTLHSFVRDRKSR